MTKFTLHLLKVVNDQPTEEQIIDCSDMTDQGKKLLTGMKQLQQRNYQLVPTEGAERHYHVYHPNGTLAYLLFTNN
jgi:hypothetical protein